MTEIALLKFAHLLCVIYWLGGDLGVFYSSYSVSNEKLSPETRTVVAKILFALDQAPRICMALMLPTGVHLGYKLGLIQVPGYVVSLIWVLGLAWLAMVLILHFRHNSPFLTIFDFWFRVVVSGSLLVLASYALYADKILLGDWLAVKVGIFALLMICGLLIRVKLKPFGPAFVSLVQGNVDDSINTTIRSSLAAVKPYVLLIWLGILVNTALGLHLIQL